MDNSEFWKHIDQASKSGDFHAELKGSLCVLGLSEIISFKNILLVKLGEANTFPLLAANFVISSYVSDDGFESFRAWLISCGSNKFLTAISDPETISEWLDEIDVDDLGAGDDLLFVADEAYVELGGNEEDFHKKIIFPNEPEIDECWPEDKVEFQKQYPKLVTKFWNQERIEDLHS